jgi:hypothetical protein
MACRRLNLRKALGTLSTRYGSWWDLIFSSSDSSIVFSILAVKNLSFDQFSFFFRLWSPVPSELFVLEFVTGGAVDPELSGIFEGALFTGFGLT